jgi:MinD-like ATPase involved in chromosome partitioning or flagellar assembly
MSKLCSKILVIETNFANPSLKNLVNIKREKKGLLDYIKGHTALSECISHDKERGIDILLAGHLPSDDELVNLDRSKISKIIKQVKEKYDFILIDTMPMLISDLAEFLMVQADIIPLVIQSDRSYYQNVYMAGQILFKLEVPAIAAVLNLGAPRYNTKFQETVVRLIQPFQELVRNLFNKTMHPEQDEPYPLFRMSWQSVNTIGTSFKLSFKKIFKTINPRVIINVCKSIFVLFLFVQITLLITYVASTANDEKSDNIKMVGDEDQNNDTLDKNNERWILKQDQSFYTIQIAVSSQKVDPASFANAHSLNLDEIAVYKNRYKGQERYSVIYGTYPSYKSANKALAALPETMLKTSRVRRIRIIQQQIINLREKG